MENINTKNTKTKKKKYGIDAFEYIQNKQWSLKQFDEYVLSVYKLGYKYGVQDIKDNYILKPR